MIITNIKQLQLTFEPTVFVFKFPSETLIFATPDPIRFIPKFARKAKFKKYMTRYKEVEVFTLKTSIEWLEFTEFICFYKFNTKKFLSSIEKRLPSIPSSDFPFEVRNLISEQEWDNLSVLVWLAK